MYTWCDPEVGHRPQESLHPPLIAGPGPSPVPRPRPRPPSPSPSSFRDCRKFKPDGGFDEQWLAQRAAATKGGLADYAGYATLADGTEPTLAAAPLFLDAGIPPIFGVEGVIPGWVYGHGRQLRHHFCTSLTPLLVSTRRRFPPIPSLPGPSMRSTFSRSIPR